MKTANFHWHAARFFRAMRNKILCSATFLVSLHAASTALAQEAEAAPAPTLSAPEWRLDFIGPTVGIGVFLAPAVSYEQAIGTLGGEVRFAHQTGHGALVRVAHGNNLWGGGTAIDLSYLYRTTLEGDARIGLSLDVSAGPSFFWLSHNQGDVPVGEAVGGHVGFTLDGRYENFTGTLGAQWHGFAPLQGAPNAGATGFEMALTVMGGLGFGFWG